MVEQLPLADELAAMSARVSGLLPSVQTVRSALDLVTSLAVEVLPGMAGAGITLTDPRGVRVTAAATDALVERADALQYELGEGPCLTAWEQHGTVRVDDVSKDRRWPRWSTAVAGTGLRSCLSSALVAGDVGLGAMKVYSVQVANFGARSEYLMHMFAAQAATLVMEVRAAERAQEISEDLRAVIRQRDVVALAKGVLMHRERVSEDEAFVMLVALARQQRVTVHEAAEGLARAMPRRRH
jgi:GAF domain-containing protein